MDMGLPHFGNCSMMLEVQLRRMMSRFILKFPSSMWDGSKVQGSKDGEASNFKIASGQLSSGELRATRTRATNRLCMLVMIKNVADAEEKVGLDQTVERFFEAMNDSSHDKA